MFLSLLLQEKLCFQISWTSFWSRVTWLVHLPRIYRTWISSIWVFVVVTEPSIPEVWLKLLDESLLPANTAQICPNISLHSKLVTTDMIQMPGKSTFLNISPSWILTSKTNIIIILHDLAGNKQYLLDIDRKDKYHSEIYSYQLCSAENWFNKKLFSLLGYAWLCYVWTCGLYWTGLILTQYINVTCFCCVLQNPQ